MSKMGQHVFDLQEQADLSGEYQGEGYEYATDNCDNLSDVCQGKTGATPNLQTEEEPDF